jgi:PAS domain S-box-containing protein
MSDLTPQLTDEFISLLAEYFARKEESVLQRAYELGRKAVGAKLTVLDMVAVQQDALVKFLLSMLGSEEIAAITKTAADLFSESLAPFELAQRSSQEGTATLLNLKLALESRVAEQTEEIRREKDFAQKLVETAQVMILVLDNEGRVIQYNPFMEKVSGYSLEGVRGRDWFSIFLPESDRKSIRELFLRVSSETDRAGINLILTKEGKERLIEWSCTTLTDSASNPVGVLCLGQDITEKVKLQEQLVEKERLAAMSVTAAKLIHEIGNPLNGMSLTVQLLERHLSELTEQNRRVKSSIENLLKEIQRLSQLIHEFKSFTGSEKYLFNPTSLASVVAEVLEFEAPGYAVRGIQVEPAIPADMPLVMADAAKLKQVLLNLCKNAVEAMPEGGLLKLRGSHSEENVILEIVDTGVGIPSTIDIFTPFTTTKSSGTGLGLMIVRQIVSMHSGQLSYSREGNKETIFRLTLPRLQSVAAPS